MIPRQLVSNEQRHVIGCCVGVKSCVALNCAEYSAVRHSKVIFGNEPRHSLVQEEVVSLLCFANRQTMRCYIVQHISRLDHGTDIVEQPSSAALALVKSILLGDLYTNLSYSLNMGERFRSSIGFEKCLNVGFQAMGEGRRNDIREVGEHHGFLLSGRQGPGCGDELSIILIYRSPLENETTHSIPFCMSKQVDMSSPMTGRRKRIAFSH